MVESRNNTFFSSAKIFLLYFKKFGNFCRAPMVLQKKTHRQRITNTPIPKTGGEAKKWQKLFRYVAEREKAWKELVDFVHLANTLAKQSTFSPESICDKNGDKIYL
jgi:hypothetical protein